MVNWMNMWCWFPHDVPIVKKIVVTGDDNFMPAIIFPHDLALNTNLWSG